MVYIEIIMKDKNTIILKRNLLFDPVLLSYLKSILAYRGHHSIKVLGVIVPAIL